MVNSVMVLTASRKKLMERKKQYQRDYENAVREIDEEIRHIDEALKLIDKAAQPYLCKACGGTGQRSRLDGAGSREDVTCEKCHGTGFSLPNP